MLSIGVFLALTIFTSSGAAPNPRCNHAYYEDRGWSEALDLCHSSDKFEKSFKFVLNEESGEVDEFRYSAKYCEGAFEYQRGAEPTNVEINSGKTCASFGFVANMREYTSSGNLVSDQYGDYTGAEGRIFGQNNNPQKTYVWFSSILFGDCFSYWPGMIWAKITGCQHDEDGLGKDVLTWVWYQDSTCSTELAEKTWIETDRVKEGSTLSAMYTKKIRENEVHYAISKDKNQHSFEVTAQDIMCYDEQRIERSDKGSIANPIYVINNEAPRNPEYQPRVPQYYGNEPRPEFYNENKGGFGDVAVDDWSYLAVNILVSIVSTLCVISVCLTMYYCFTQMQRTKQGRVQWSKIKANDSDLEA